MNLLANNSQYLVHVYLEAGLFVVTVLLVGRIGEEYDQLFYVLPA